MAGKIIEILVLLAGLLITAAIVISIPLKSYNEYKDYLAQVEEQNKANQEAAIKPKLESLTVELKEGVRYFANDMADATINDFNVTANYVKGEETYSEPVEEGKFAVNTPSDFYTKGGEVTISYKGVSATLTIELEPVVLESLSIAVNPYTIKYAQGATFDDAGMIVYAHYNDGTTKTLASDEYTVDTKKTLSVSDKAVSVSYTAGEVTKSATVAIGVSETLDNGAVTSIVIVDKAIVNAGDVITNAAMEVNAVYESGNRKLLTSDEYSISGSAGALEFGKTYELTVSYNADTTKTAKTAVTVRQTLQGEDGVIVGGKKNTETEYAVIDGVITELGHKVSFAGNFSASVLKGQEASLTLTLISSASTVGDITMRCGNSYCVNAADGYSMKPLQINTILDLTVNGREVRVPANVILKGCGPAEKYAPLFGIYYEFTFEDIQLDAGVNKIEFHFKKSTVGATNCWGESPSTLNIDYVNFDSTGSEIPDEYTITDIEISDLFVPTYTQKFDEVKVPVIATIDNGSKIAIDYDLYDITVSGGPEGYDYFLFGTYTITATLKSDPSVTTSKEVTLPEVESITILTASVEIIDGRAYYVFTGNATGITAEEVKFFDGSTKFNFTFETTPTTFVLRIDATDMAIGTYIYPHLSVNGENYANGANAAGDIRDNGLSFANGQYVTLNGKKYTIVNEYSMPCLSITEAPTVPTETSYYGIKDNNFASSKALLKELKWGSEGVTTSGTQSNADEYIDGIGGLDKLDRSVTYTFTVDADGKVDFIWNIAGNKWNGSGNDGLTNMADHMIITIDGKKVEVGGIALPAGTGTATDIWWNLQQIVIKDVNLTAGEHEFKCIITTAGAGLNVGAMEIYFQAN